MRELVVGIGNPWRQDDGAGPALARRVAELVPESVTLRCVRDDLLGLLPEWGAYRSAIVCDAIASSAPGAEPPGAIRCWRLPEELPRELPGGPSTHAMALSEIWRLAGTLGQRPPRALLVGIVGRDFGHGEGLSPPVAAAVERAARMLLRWIRDQEEITCTNAG